MDKFYVNPRAIVFIPEADKTNNYETVVCDWDKEEFLKINRSAYIILKAVKENPGITSDGLVNLLGRNRVILASFIEKMVQKNILFRE